jgi:hypothetical protein
LSTVAWEVHPINYADNSFISNSKYVIAKSFWGIDKADLYKVLAEYALDTEEYFY